MISNLPLYLNIVAQNKKKLLNKSQEEYQNTLPKHLREGSI